MTKSKAESIGFTYNVTASQSGLFFHIYCYNLKVRKGAIVPSDTHCHRLHFRIAKFRF